MRRCREFYLELCDNGFKGVEQSTVVEHELSRVVFVDGNLPPPPHTRRVLHACEPDEREDTTTRSQMQVCGEEDEETGEERGRQCGANGGRE
jgi:hypothetical protein